MSINLARIRRSSMRSRVVGVVALILLAGITAFLFTVYSPTDRSGTTQTVKIAPGSSVSQVSQALGQEGVVGHPLAFALWLVVTGSARHIQAGTYSLSPTENYEQIRLAITRGGLTSTRLTAIEGWTVAQIGGALQTKGLTTQADFAAAAKVSAFPGYSFLAGLPPDQGLEGYLFPDTYSLTTNQTPSQIIALMLTDFGSRTAPLATDIRASGYSLAEVITLASIVEREASSETDQKLVAGILIKRLKAGIPLQSDVTSLYEIGDWRHVLTAEDLAKNTAYNTRIHKGLPPTPIGNPGLVAIGAVLHPTASPYLFYLADSSGVMHYAKTLEEHNANKAKYLH